MQLKIRLISGLVSDNKKFLGLITRCKDEFFVEEFCNYYLKQGVDEINIIDDNSSDKTIYTKLLGHKNINIFFEKNITKKNYFSNWMDKLSNNYEWVIYVDVDEFISTRKNLNHTIKDELETTFKDAHCVKVPWVMMSCKLRETNPKSILNEITYRWNHDIRHPHKVKKFRCRYHSIETKCIFKPMYFDSVSTLAGDDHHPHGHDGDADKIRDGVKNKKSELNAFYENLRESDIKNAHLICYHYRIISVEQCKRKLKTNTWYQHTNGGYTLNDLLSSDHPEIIDETMKHNF